MAVWQSCSYYKLLNYYNHECVTRGGTGGKLQPGFRGGARHGANYKVLWPEQQASITGRARGVRWCTAVIALGFGLG